MARPCREKRVATHVEVVASQNAAEIIDCFTKSDNYTKTIKCWRIQLNMEFSI